MITSYHKLAADRHSEMGNTGVKVVDDDVGMSTDEDQLLDCDQTERFLLVSKPTLARMRVNGTGPPYVQISANRVGYLKSDLLTYLKSRRRRSTLD